MRLTEEQYIAKFRKLAGILNEDNNVVGQQSQQQQQNTQSQEGGEEINDALGKLVQHAATDTQLINSLANELPSEIIDENKINEIGVGGVVGLAGSVILSAPEIMELIGHGLKRSGEKINSNILQKIGNWATKLGHNTHHTYIETIKKGLNLNSKIKMMNDEQKTEIANVIFYTMVAGMGVLAYKDAAGAATVGYAATKTSLAAVKTNEIYKRFKNDVKYWDNLFLKPIYKMIQKEPDKEFDVNKSKEFDFKVK